MWCTVWILEQKWKLCSRSSLPKPTCRSSTLPMYSSSIGLQGRGRLRLRWLEPGGGGLGGGIGGGAQVCGALVLVLAGCPAVRRERSHARERESFATDDLIHARDLVVQQVTRRVMKHAQCRLKCRAPTSLNHSSNEVQLGI